MQKIIGKTTEYTKSANSTNSSLLAANKRPASPTTSTASTSSSSSLNSGNSSTSSSNEYSSSKTQQHIMSATTQPALTKNSSQFDINSLMMAAAAVAANSKSATNTTSYPIKENKSKLNNNDDYANEYYGNHADTDSPSKNNSNNEIEEDDESDSNYLNKLRRHKLSVTSGNSLNANEIKADLIGNSSVVIDELSGAKKRKRQFTSSGGNSQRGDGVNDTVEDDLNDENDYSGKHLRGSDERPVSRRKSRNLNYYHEEMEDDENVVGGEKYYSGEDMEDMEVGQINGNHDEEETAEEGEEEDGVYQGGLEMGEMRDEEEENGLENGENEELNGEYDGNEEDIGERNSLLRSLHLQQKQQFSDMHKRFLSHHHHQADYGLGDEQSALIASTLANLAQAASMNPGQLPNLAGSGQPNPNQSNGKIFHVDAYCYLCKKEFCNKYFLRTHLANKHKVFLNSNDLSTLTGASMSKLQNDLFKENKRNNSSHHRSSNNSGSNKMKSNSGNTNGRSSSASSTESAHSSRSTSSLSDSPNAHQPLTIANVLYNKAAKLPGHDEQQQQLLYTNPNSTNTANNNTASSTTTSSLMIEDFCELCNKQFCNKYYLKKHKFDVHGILVENNIKSYKKIDDSPQQSATNKQQHDQSSPFNNNNNNSSQRTNSMNNIISGTTTAAAASTPTGNSTAFNFPGLNNNQSHSLALANMMFVNPYMSPMMQLPHILPVTGTITQQGHESGHHPSKNDQSNNAANSDASPTSSSSSSSTASSSSSKSTSSFHSTPTATNNNTDTTNNSNSMARPAKPEGEKVSVACDLCKKEFFNEEFLKLHRINKHKIQATGEAKTNAAPTPPVLAASPPSSANLSPSESPQPLADVDNLQKLLQQQHKDLLLTNSSKQQHTLTSSSSKPAANKQFPPNFDMNSIAGISTPAIFGIMDSYFAAKMADRVTCDICNKQVCNKYFLKTHKLKVHGCVDTGSGDNNDQNEYEMNEDMMNEMANEVTGRMTTANNNNNNQETESNSGDNSNEANEAMSMARQLQNSLSQLRATSSPNKALAQLFNKSTLAAMGLDQQNNAAALAATLANLSQYNPMAMNGSASASMSSQVPSQKPKPPALARVSCQICRKELCNKYFLKSHLLNAHHISADDLYMNNMLEQQQQQQSPPPSSNSQGEKLLKAFNMFNNSERQTDSPAASMRSTSSSYTGNSGSNKRVFKQGSEDLEDGQQQQNGDEEDVGKTRSSFHALMNYAGSPKGGEGGHDSMNTLAFGAGCNMQPFLFECKDESFVSNFVPCMVYLPVKSKLEMPVNIKVTLKPLDAESVAMAAASSSMNRSVSQADDDNDEDVENF